jgi:CRP/FNR family transcriptional regulator, LitR-dependent transcriptional activator
MTLNPDHETPTWQSSSLQESLRFLRGQWVYSQGSPAKRLFRIETGLLRLVKVTQKGRVLTVRHLLPGDYFGEEALEPDGLPHTHCGTSEQTTLEQTVPPFHYQYGVEALTRTLVVPLEPHALEPAEATLMVRNLSEQLGRAMQYGFHLQTGELKQRVVRYLLELVDTPLGGEDGENLLFVKATHELIAEGTFSTRESVSKVITELREAEYIESGYRQITLKNLEGLQNLVAPIRALGITAMSGAMSGAMSEAMSKAMSPRALFPRAL